MSVGCSGLVGELVAAHDGEVHDDLFEVEGTDFFFALYGDGDGLLLEEFVASFLKACDGLGEVLRGEGLFIEEKKVLGKDDSVLFGVEAFGDAGCLVGEAAGSGEVEAFGGVGVEAFEERGSVDGFAESDVDVLGERTDAEAESRAKAEYGTRVKAFGVVDREVGPVHDAWHDAQEVVVALEADREELGVS